MRVQLRKAVEADAVALAPKLRQSDLNEMIACGWKDPQEALVASFGHSQLCYTLELDGKVIALQGLSEGIHPMHGAIWAMGSDTISKVPRDIYELGFIFTDECLGYYPMVGNMVHVENRLHIRWLRRIGYTFLRKFKYNNNLFYEFIKVKNV